MKERLLIFLFGFTLVSFLALPAYLLPLEEVEFKSGSSLLFSIEVWQLMFCVFLISQIFYWSRITQIFGFLNNEGHSLIITYFMPYARIFPIWLILFVVLLFGKSSIDLEMKFFLLFIIAMPVLFYMVWVDGWCKKNMPDYLNRYGNEKNRDAESRK